MALTDSSWRALASALISGFCSWKMVGVWKLGDESWFSFAVADISLLLTHSCLFLAIWVKKYSHWLSTYLGRPWSSMLKTIGDDNRSQLAILVFLPIMVIMSTLTLMTKCHHLASVLGSCHTHWLYKAQFHRYVHYHQLWPAENNPYWTANDAGASPTTSPFLITI